MTSAPATNGVFVVIPPNNASGIRPGPAMLPRTLCQSPGTLQFEEPPLGPQPPGNAPPQRLLPAETFLNGEPKALGTVQILIGLIYISFGSVLLMFRRGYVGMLFVDGGIPFWGGVCFIISGSLSVAAEKHHTSCLVKSSLGMNILNIIASFAATAILLMDFGVTNWDVGRGYLAVLTIFTILEFFIAVIATYFGCQATRSSTNTQSMVFLPNAFSTDFNIPSPAATPPPAYDNVAYTSKEASE
ncbi:membrane-spanning 4-domains subfamily A member 15 isoform X1 [Antechinus flavipes]|uniref:membrane-spanning 4-domains subfamily A member 15 isoform X1 n=1 Tax=Antechinus flavipes TaxID=38775 RepID=UPI0022365ED4|nr:membrane-spanning 4-domains subfamily A member 15 isoform X1 [Antechinus flavipes]XP_051821038.1 membrane-spanning 4-domains subfamily A member 15 isoform X1 [Antechinus flavipes]XP_051821039.1 membrane-spanning 4-domains subfamily A member 15 isoform X1 [Antechinus flavipes]XP_051821040.1 membrane-spanning 4-domains subfamily A member 15 isoform X1 [Antechinus flavipes]XP_051821041.1 membrane-spanning 4-domains subfamily A member 15 isoform X1 [Antechinus flavipes]XP_051821042.1 membrane-s